MANVVAALGRLGEATLDLVFPPRCVCCGSGGAFLCAACTEALPVAAAPRCPRCWRPGADALCGVCKVTPPAFDALRSAFVYDGPVREIVHAFKYRGMTSLGQSLASLLVDVFRREGFVADAIVPVPLSGLRRRTRGYNQAGVLAKAVGRELVVPVESRSLVRRRHTPPQARSADAEARRRNVDGAFVARAKNLRGARILLVDDVTTTGSTLSACAATLRASGASSVSALTLARED